MNSFLVLQQGQPQPGWGLQYTLDLKPVGARSYEPDALTTHTSANNIAQLMNFYKLTGDTKFLARIPEALDWLDSVKLPPELVTDNRTHPTFIELGTNRPLFVHRRGSNVVNGEYYVDDNPQNTVVHYSSTRIVDVPKLRQRYEQLKATPPERGRQELAPEGDHARRAAALLHPAADRGLRPQRQQRRAARRRCRAGEGRGDDRRPERRGLLADAR